MQEVTQCPYAPATVPPPAETLVEWAEDVGLTPEWLRTCLGLSLPELVPLLDEPPAVLTPHMATQLEALTDIPARLWNRLERLYRAHLERLERLAV